MGLSDKRIRFIDEYLVDLNASEAAIRAGYTAQYARQTAYKILQDEEVRAEVESRLSALRMSPDEIVLRLEKMAMGIIPTKRVEGSHAREEYDTHSAAVSLGKVYALFHDKIDLDISHLNITDE